MENWHVKAVAEPKEAKKDDKELELIQPTETAKKTGVKK